MAFTLRDIPHAMRREGWLVGAGLMERWLQARAWAMPDRIKTGGVAAPGRMIDTRLVKMSWLLKFGRAAAAHRRLVGTWASPARRGASIVQIERQFRKWIAAMPSPLPTTPIRFGNLARDVPWINEYCAINIQSIDSPWYGSIDDLYAALGRAILKIAVSGSAVLDKDGWALTIDEIGTFVRDTYDFNGDQPLGSWGLAGFSRMAVAAPAIAVDWRREPTFWQRQHDYFTVSNQSFRDYRATFGMGGDFVVFSDLQRMVLHDPIVVRFAA